VRLGRTLHTRSHVFVHTTVGQGRRGRGSLGDDKETRIDLAVSSVCGRTFAEDAQTAQIGDRGDVAGGGMALEGVHRDLQCAAGVGWVEES
jgi:hypothetical protein